MKTQDKIRMRLIELRDRGNCLKVGNEVGQQLSQQHEHDCRGWLAAVQNSLYLLFGNIQHPYRVSIESICAARHGLMIPTQVGNATAILEQLIADLDDELIFSIENRVRAIVFDDFLDEAKQYAKANHICEAGVFAAAVFEDTIRSICRKCGIKEAGVKTDKLIVELTKVEALSDLKAKQARHCAGVRNKAMHAQWVDIGPVDVDTLISFTEVLISLLDET